MASAGSMNSFFEMVSNAWHKIDLKKWSQNIGGSSAEAVHAALCFALAFTAGVVLKKYFKHLVSGTIITIITITFFEYHKVLTIDGGILKAMAGMGTTADLNQMINIAIAWIKNNIFIFSASVIGVLLGYRLG